MESFISIVLIVGFLVSLGGSFWAAYCDSHEEIDPSEKSAWDARWSFAVIVMVIGYIGSKVLTWKFG